MGWKNLIKPNGKLNLPENGQKVITKEKDGFIDCKRFEWDEDFLTDEPYMEDGYKCWADSHEEYFSFTQVVRWCEIPKDGKEEK